MGLQRVCGPPCEPFANAHAQDNLNPVGQIFYAASATICVPGGMSQAKAEPLGAQAGEERTYEVARRAGFTRRRRAAETPFNLVYAPLTGTPARPIQGLGS